MDKRSAWGVLRRNGAFRRYWLAQLISFAGDFISQVALSALIFQLTGKATMVAALMVATTLPTFVASIWAGVVADRFDRIRLMLACDLIRALLILGLLLVKGASQIWLALLVIALTETVSAFFEPASAAALPGLVEPSDLPGAIALTSASWSTMLAVGAALGGAITAHWGSQAAFVANSLSFVVSACLLVGLPQATPAVGERPPMRLWQDLRDGLNYVGNHPHLLSLLLIKVAFGLGMGVLSLLTVLPLTFFSAGQEGVATLFTARGVGAVAGPLLAQRWIHQTQGRRAGLAGWGLVLAGAFYALVARSPTLFWAAIWVVVAHIGSGIQWVLSTTLLQQNSEDEFRGRVMALDLTGVTLAITLSTFVFGWAMDLYGARPVGMFGSLLLAGLGLLWLAVFRPGRWNNGTDGVGAASGTSLESQTGG